jgi:hypothetical protein
MTGFKMTTSPSAGYVLTSDGSGVGSWTDVSSTAGPWTLADDDLYPDSTSYNVAIGANDAGSAKLYVSGNVGIGTTGPVAPFHIARDYGGGEDIWMSFENTTAGGYGDWTFGKVANSDLTIFLGKDTSQPFYTFDYTGNLGIGRTSPDQKLEIGGGNISLARNSDSDGSWGIGISNNSGSMLGSAWWGGLEIAKVSTANTLHLVTSSTGAEAGQRRMTIASTGNVGIGTTGPTQKLDVSGNIRTTGNLYLADDNGLYLKDTDSGHRIYRDSSVTRTRFTTGTSGGFRFTSTDEDVLFEIDSGGNVGIGTTGPDVPLHIYQGATNPGIKLSGSGTTDYLQIFQEQSGGHWAYVQAKGTSGLMLRASDSGQDVVLQSATDGKIMLGETVNPEMIIERSSGNVGIGTTAPNNKLDVAGTVEMTGFKMTSDGSGVGSWTDVSSTAGPWTLADDDLYPDSTAYNVAIGANDAGSAKLYIDGNVGIGTTSPTAALDVSSGNIYMGSNTVNWGTSGTTRLRLRGTIGWTSDIETDAGAGMTFRIGDTGATGGFHFLPKNAEALTIKADGNVGIGTTGPGAKLQINTDATSTTGLTLRANATSDDFIKFLNTSGSEVGRFDLTGGDVLYMQGGSAVAIAGGFGNLQSYVDYTISTQENNNDIIFSTHGTGDIVATTDSDSYLIGSTSAGGDLYVAGTRHATAGDIFLNPDGGNVGIGTTGPGAKLHLHNNTTAGPSIVFTDNIVTNGFRVGLTVDEHGIIWNYEQDRHIRFGTYNDEIARFWSSGGFSFGDDFITDPGTDNIIIEGNVGIGTTGPSQKLHIDGDMRLEGALYDVNNEAGSSSQILSSTGSGVDWVDIGTIGVGGTGTTGYVPKWIGSSSLGDSVIYDDGTNVGIGTTGPTYKLEINSNDGIKLTGAASLYANAVDFNLYVDGGRDFRFRKSDGTDFVLINGTSGNVGIGTTAPAELLDVAGDIRSTTGTIQVGNAANQAYNRLGTATADYSGITGATDLLIEGDLEVQGTASISALLTPYHHVITVAKQGGDFTTITAALSSITDNSSTNTYLIRVMPGTYNEAITMKEYVDIIGSGWEVTKIAQADATVVTGASNSRIEGFEIEFTGSSYVATGMVSMTSLTNFLMRNIYFDYTNSGTLQLFYCATLNTNVRIKDSRVNASNKYASVYTSGSLYIENVVFTTNFQYFTGTINSSFNTFEGTFTVGSGATVNSYKDSFQSTITNSGTFNKKDYALAPLASATQAVLPMWVTAPSTLSSSGTYLGVNAASGYTGDYINLLLNDSSKFKIDYQGNVTVTDDAWYGIGSSLERIVFDSDGNDIDLLGGNVGIGTTAPANKLDVAGTVEMTGFKLTTSPSSGYVLTSDGAGVGTWTDVSSTAGPWTLADDDLYPDSTSYNVAIGAQDAGTAKLYVSGNVGIGTTGPGARLSFAAGTTAADGIDFGGDVNLYRSGSSQLRTDDTFDIRKTAYVNADASTTGLLVYRGSVEFGNTTYAAGDFFIRDGATSGDPYQLYLNTSNNTFELFNDANIDSNATITLGYDSSDTIVLNGNVGIGTTSPNNKLDVAGTAEMTGFKMTTSPSAGYVLTSDGAGVGTWTDVSSTAGPWTLADDDLYPDSTSYNVAIGAQDAGSAKLYVSGNVGIGTTDPGSYKLNVQLPLIMGGQQLIPQTTLMPSGLWILALTITLTQPALQLPACLRGMSGLGQRDRRMSSMSRVELSG